MMISIMADKFKLGFSAKIASIDDTNPASKRLFNMGLTPDTQLCIVNIAPLGDPIIIKVRNYNLAIRKKDLAAISFKDVKEVCV